jgi:hypothetical protein
VPEILAIAEFGGVQPLYGVVRAARAARAADGTPRCLVCFIGGACAPSVVHSVEIPGSPGPAKMAPAMPCVNAVLWVYKPKRKYHVTVSDDTCYIQSRETELRRAPRGYVTGRPVSGRNLVGRRERTCTGSPRTTQIRPLYQVLLG